MVSTLTEILKKVRNQTQGQSEPCQTSAEQTVQLIFFFVTLMQAE